MSLRFLKKCLCTTIATILFTSFAFATVEKAEEPEKTEASEQAMAKISQKLTAMQMQVIDVKAFVVDGLYEVITNQGVFYVSEDAQFLINGNVLDIDNGMNNISAKSMAALSQAKLQAFEKEMIVYKAPNEKHVVTVFTDTNCGYCLKLHAEMADYHKQGITIRYLAFPRGGMESSTYHSMVSIWCADEPKSAMNAAKARKKVKYKTCDNSVKEQYELGRFLGVNATPTMVFEDGSLSSGYAPADQLIKILDAKFK